MKSYMYAALTSGTIFSTLLTAVTVLAEDPVSGTMPPNAPAGGPQTLRELLELLSTLSGWMFAFVLVAAVGAIIAGGIMYVTSAGEAKRTSTAAKMITYALIGVVAAGLAWALVNVTGNLIFGETLIPTTPGEGECQGWVCINSGVCYGEESLCRADPLCPDESSCQQQ